MKKIEGDAEKCDCIHVHEDIVEKVEEKMPQDEQLADLAEFFRIFGDATRIRILYVLIATLLGMTQSAISHQLRVLKQMDLVKNRREGKTVFYSLADGHIKTILSQGIEHINE